MFTAAQNNSALALLIIVLFVVFVRFMWVFVLGSLATVVGYAFWVTRWFWVGLGLLWWNLAKIFAYALIVVAGCAVFGEYRPAAFLMIAAGAVFIYAPAMAFAYIIGMPLQ